MQACSQDTEIDLKESDVPPDVVAAFKGKHPTARNVEWEAEKKGGQFYFEADFEEDSLELEVKLAPDGSFLK
ncbi:hypothetical protein FPE01S_02_06960 [Flavihumibacter petaseus NBRC 106054]|uniref:Uncharacterized protein n=2 Tax=Flavihumibacter TaxID=1004301 RepID=A0A0E9N2N3_9BACT|nr:hypothetical protein FPE01S_02_06960 [Flavihumibacter petaseus NBRC 106054]